MKTKNSIIILFIVIPIIMIALQLLFLFFQLIAFEITYFGFQDAQFTDEEKAVYFSNIIPLWIMGGLFILTCVFFIVYGFISKKEFSKKVNVVFLFLTQVVSIFLLITPIIQTSYIFKIGVFRNNPNLLISWGFYLYFGPAFISGLLVIPLWIVCLKKLISDLKK